MGRKLFSIVTFFRFRRARSAQHWKSIVKRAYTRRKLEKSRLFRGWQQSRPLPFSGKKGMRGTRSVTRGGSVQWSLFSQDSKYFHSHAPQVTEGWRVDPSLLSSPLAAHSFSFCVCIYRHRYIYLTSDSFSGITSDFFLKSVKSSPGRYVAWKKLVNSRHKLFLFFFLFFFFLFFLVWFSVRIVQNLIYRLVSRFGIGWRV